MPDRGKRGVCPDVDVEVRDDVNMSVIDGGLDFGMALEYN